VDNTPSLNAFYRYALATGAKALQVPPKSYAFLTRPNAFYGQSGHWSVSILGSGNQGSSFNPSYAEDSWHGLLQTLPNANGGGFSVKDLTIVSGRTNFGGIGIYALSGRLTPVTVGGTVTAGNVVTVTIQFSAGTFNASYTVQAGDTLAKIARGLDAAIHANGTLTGALFTAATVDNVLYVIGDPLTTYTVTASSNGTATVTVGMSNSYTNGYIFLENIVITSANGWDWPLKLDGRRAVAAATPSVRTINLTNCAFFGGQFAAAEFQSCAGVQWNGGYSALAGGTSGDVIVSGLATVPTGNSNLNVGAVGGNLKLDACENLQVTCPLVGINLTNTSNTRYATVRGRVTGTVGTSWVNSSYEPTVPPIAFAMKISNQSFTPMPSRLDFTSELYDASGNYDPSISRFSCPYGGRYRVSGQLLLNGVTPVGESASIYVYRNGVNAVGRIGYLEQRVTGAFPTGTFQAIVACNSGDYLEIYAAAGASSSTVYGQDVTLLTIEYLG
jgi:hypothetical protein